jgi:hypothetical protein
MEPETYGTPRRKTRKSRDLMLSSWEKWSFGMRKKWAKYRVINHT